ncbi:MAG TPA: SDR family oxidoreductase [Anaerovoracaceae bacterium]|nr:SDR family oxidoreductase [Anaerovoracaceae bacterium]
MELGLKDKVALVTGGAKGIGLEIARAFLEEGCKVVISDIDAGSLETARKSLDEIGECLALECDVTKADDVEMMMRSTEERFGTLDILINNAGVLKPCLVEDLDEKIWDFSMGVNLKSTFLCSKYGYLLMKKHGGGVIINAASFAAVISSIGHGAYGAAKAAVVNLTRTCAAEFAPSNVRVNAYVPGVVATHLTAEMRRDALKAEKMLNDIPLRKFADPGDIASVIVFLASDKASYMTGSIVEIHGGKLCVQNPGAIYNH